MEETDVVRALAALAQETRLRTFRLLVVAGPEGLTPGQMAETLGTAPTALSFHLKELSHAGLIGCERNGRHLIYRASFPLMNELLGFLTAHCCQGQACLTPTTLDCNPAKKSTVVHTPSAPSAPATPSVFNVLLLCTGNSARSIMAEAILNHRGRGRFQAFSAGSHPTGQVHPLAIELLERHHYETSGLRSKHWNEFAQTDAPHMHFVLTVCDKAAGETCPLWPGQPVSAHWGVPDPAAVEGDGAAAQQAFAQAFMILSRRIALLVDLPYDKLDSLALQHQLEDIGRQGA